jgi:hypothetical protein
MFRRRQINAGRSGAVKRSLLGAADAARWPFERVAWQVERRALWPLRERAAGWGLSSNVAGAAALCAVAIAAILTGVLLSGGGEAAETARIAVPARVAVVPAPVRHPSAEPTGPKLQGVPPSFGVGKGVGVAKQPSAGTSGQSDAGGASSAAQGGAGGADNATGAAAGGSAAAEDGAAAASSAAKPVAAGPEAMKVARRFSEAFVFYEIGRRPARAKTVFGETASEQLAKALEERPPRLPQGTRVPKAEVVNLVPGPRRGGAYTVSVSLRRVGVTSELRLSLEHSKAEGWRVGNVLG